jgi:hypothetical protein
MQWLNGNWLWDRYVENLSFVIYLYTCTTETEMFDGYFPKKAKKKKKKKEKRKRKRRGWSILKQINKKEMPKSLQINYIICTNSIWRKKTLHFAT